MMEKACDMNDTIYDMNVTFNEMYTDECNNATREMVDDICCGSYQLYPICSHTKNFLRRNFIA